MKKRTVRAPKDWQCNECGRRMTYRTVERSYATDGCPGCGGTDFEPAALDLQTLAQTARRD